MTSQKLESICIWHPNQECIKAKLITNPDGKCDGYNTKCFAYLPQKTIEEREKERQDKKIMEDYQI